MHKKAGLEPECLPSLHLPPKSHHQPPPKAWGQKLWNIRGVTNPQEGRVRLWTLKWGEKRLCFCTFWKLYETLQVQVVLEKPCFRERFSIKLYWLLILFFFSQFWWKAKKNLLPNSFLNIDYFILVSTLILVLPFRKKVLVMSPLEAYTRDIQEKGLFAKPVCPFLLTFF